MASRITACFLVTILPFAVKKTQPKEESLSGGTRERIKGVVAAESSRWSRGPARSLNVFRSFAIAPAAFLPRIGSFALSVASHCF